MPSANVTPARKIGAKTEFFPGNPRRHHSGQRSFNFNLRQRQISGHLVAQKHSNFLEKLAERFRRNIFAADQRQLVLDQRMVDDGDTFHEYPPVATSQNTVPSLTTLTGGEPLLRSLLAMIRPADHVPPSRTLASGSDVSSIFMPPAHGIREPVEKRHGERAPLDDQRRRNVMLARRVRRVAKRQHAGIDEKAAVAIFGEAGQTVDVQH